MKLFLAVILSFFLFASPALALTPCPTKPQGEFAFPSELKVQTWYGYVQIAKFKKRLGRECFDGDFLHFYAVYLMPNKEDQFVAAVVYRKGKGIPGIEPGFYRGWYNKYIGLPEKDDRNVPAGQFWHPEYGCCEPECLDAGFVSCVATKISAKFPFDIFANLPSNATTCPLIKVEIGTESREFDFCWIYEGMRPLKYAVAMSLLIKFFMHS